jgi:regulator of protease activity HflC (stomatin/prohibitin superfamily)
MSALVFVLVMVLFILFLAGLFSVAEGERGPLTRLRQPTSTRQKRSRVNAVARLAMQRAGYEGGDAYIQVSDVGLLAYRTTDEPRLVRYNDVLVDTHYLRPFVTVVVPHQARGVVRFEIVDEASRVRYADETRYDLERGDNTLLPGTWLPLQNKTINPARWRLRIVVGDTLLAVHEFGWQDVGGGDLQRYIKDDGEISPALQQALHQAGAGQSMSLSELLADQEE